MVGKNGIKSSLSLLLYSLYAIDIRIFRKVVVASVKKLEGDEMYSLTLRQIYSNYHDINIGLYSYGGCFSLVHVPSGTTFGRYCSVARNVSILNGNHPLDLKSLHPIFYNPTLGYIDKLLIKRTRLTIENDVWIGANVTILPSVSRIENGAVIGAGSIVTKNVPAFAVVMGNPASVIKYRFSEDKIRAIIKSAWWEKDMSDLESDLMSFTVPYV